MRQITSCFVDGVNQFPAGLSTAVNQRLSRRTCYGNLTPNLSTAIFLQIAQRLLDIEAGFCRADPFG